MKNNFQAAKAGACKCQNGCSVGGACCGSGGCAFKKLDNTSIDKQTGEAFPEKPLVISSDHKTVKITGFGLGSDR